MDNQNNDHHDHFHAMQNSCGHKDCGGGNGQESCMFCSTHSNCKHSILRIILLIAIIVFTFWLGKMVGEFRGEYKGQSYMMRGGSSYDGGYGQMRYFIKNEDCTNRKSTDQVQNDYTNKDATWQGRMMQQ